VANGLGLYVRVHADIAKTVVYLGSEANGGFLPVGTGFLGALRYTDHDFGFLITANHVLALAGDGPSEFVIGMMVAYHLVGSAQDQITVLAIQGQAKPESGYSVDERNTGFAMVVPIERIFEIPESKQLTNSMDEVIARGPSNTRVRPAARAQSPFAVVEPFHDLEF
jgi:hypothetical protein